MTMTAIEMKERELDDRAKKCAYFVQQVASLARKDKANMPPLTAPEAFVIFGLFRTASWFEGRIECLRTMREMLGRAGEDGERSELAESIMHQLRSETLESVASRFEAIDELRRLPSMPELVDDFAKLTEEYRELEKAIVDSDAYKRCYAMA